MLDARILLTTAHEEHVKLLIKRLGVRQYARHLLLQVEVRGALNTTEHAR